MGKDAVLLPTNTSGKSEKAFFVATLTPFLWCFQQHRDNRALFLTHLSLSGWKKRLEDKAGVMKEMNEQPRVEIRHDH